MSLNNLLKYQNIFIDLDDTIYREFNYMNFAFEYIAESVVKKSSFYISQHLHRYLKDSFICYGRRNLYQRFINEFKIKNFSLEEYLNCLRTVLIQQNSIPVFEEMEHFLKVIFEQNKRIIILTNGNPIQQKNKINAVSIPHKEKFDIIFMSFLGKKFQKPNPHFVLEYLRQNKLKKHESVFIGDSEVDKETASNADIDFYLKQKPNGLHNKAI